MQAPDIVHVVDDDAGVRDSVKFLLELNGWQARVYAAAADLLASTPPCHGCVITDFQMPGCDGFQLQEILAARGCRLPVIMMTAHGDVPAAIRAMKGGALDFLEKPFSDETLLKAVRGALETNRRRLEERRRTTKAVELVAGLTPREREVLDQMVSGKSTKEIAQVLGASPRTIDVHRARVFQKLNAHTLPELVHLVLLAEAAPPSSPHVRKED